MAEKLYYDELTLTGIGKLHLCVSNKGIRSLYFMSKDCDQSAIEMKIKKHSPTAILMHDPKVTTPYITQINKVWIKKNVDLGTIKHDAQGTSFQKSVWSALLEIQSGETMQYNQIAEKIGRPKAIRAAASAVAQNPISLLIPCHRVVPKSGGIGNYAGGSEIKMALLKHENAI